MKVITILSLLLLTSAAFGELTKEDLHDLKEDLRMVIKEEITASEKRTREYIDLKIDALDKSLNAKIDVVNNKLSARIDVVDNKLSARIDEVDKTLNRVWLMIIALIGLITATIAIPQIIVAYRDRGQKEMQTQIEQLRARIEAMENTPS